MRPGNFLVPGYTVYYRRLRDSLYFPGNTDPGRCTSSDGSKNKSQEIRFLQPEERRTADPQACREGGRPQLLWPQPYRPVSNFENLLPRRIRQGPATSEALEDCPGLQETPVNSDPVQNQLLVCNKEATSKDFTFSSGSVRLYTLHSTPPVRPAENQHLREDSPATASP
ncbi:hypothetical protein NDU88_013184 [Pleurodeles waltl]|uniref:Uncharacterized protein n=1 Tax=Pleurodeles waltl TaxID=8319 RepID=A0AAV7R4W7_PLEWA|nr:hypothetical protein NDU88_013184 [Pleurodeles waltl]